jgi:hypothetical protein
MPAQINPAEFILDLVNTDFASSDGQAEPTQLVQEQFLALQTSWTTSNMAKDLQAAVAADTKEGNHKLRDFAPSSTKTKPGFFSMLLTLLHRSFIKSYRDIVAYWVRVAMYIGLSILMGTVWLRLDSNQESIQPFINSIFFGAACKYFSKTRNTCVDE